MLNGSESIEEEEDPVGTGPQVASKRGDEQTGECAAKGAGDVWGEDVRVWCRLRRLGGVLRSEGVLYPGGVSGDWSYINCH